MRKKELTYVITFHTTSEAIAFEKACKEEKLPGRLIPVPGMIRAGCGLAWSMPVNSEAEFQRFAGKRELGYEAAGEYMI